MSRKKAAVQHKVHKKVEKKGLPVWIRWAALVLLLVLAAAAMIFFREKLATPSNVAKTLEPIPYLVSPNKAFLLYQGGAYLLDVRTQQEYVVYRIPNITGNPVHNIPLAELSSHLDEIPRDSRYVVIICETGDKSLQARELLVDQGYTLVTSVDGGLMKWIELGLPVEGTYPN